MPITTLDSTFLAHVTALEDVSAAADEATTLQGQRKWMYPPLASWGGDPLDITGIDSAFDRSALNTQYETLINDTDQESKIGETMVTKLQVDYIAVMERAFRTRHCSSIRAKIHAASRRRGQGDVAGTFSGSVSLWLQRMLQAAHDDLD